MGVWRAETLAAFEEVFRSLGYVVCTDGEQETGIEKIAVFVDPRQFPTHVARQLPSGRWTSKLGELEDIAHELHALAGKEYGAVSLLMKRPVSRVAIADSD